MVLDAEELTCSLEGRYVNKSLYCNINYYRILKRNNPYTKKFTNVKCVIQWFLECS